MLMMAGLSECRHWCQRARGRGFAGALKQNGLALDVYGSPYRGLGEMVVAPKQAPGMNNTQKCC